MASFSKFYNADRTWFASRSGHQLVFVNLEDQAKFIADDIMYFFFNFQEICVFTFHVKCEDLFSMKNLKNIYLKVFCQLQLWLALHKNIVGAH